MSEEVLLCLATMIGGGQSPGIVVGTRNEYWYVCAYITRCVGSRVFP